MTVLFADVVRSMDLAAALDMERLREIVTDVVERCATVARRYGGGTVEYTGDGVMVLFGAPAALEDNAFRACLAALAIQQEALELAQEVRERDGVTLQLRVGLNSGQVIAGEVGAESSRYVATGETVGFAHRMQSVAPPGGVMLAESTARLVEGRMVVGEPERVRIKGTDTPVRARQLMAIGPPNGVARHSEASLIGRHHEMAALEAELDGAIGGRGAVVNIQGPPGIGKSRMAREAAALATSRGVDTLWTYCESHTSDVPFRVVAQLLRTTTGTADLDDDAARTRVREHLRGVDPQDLLLLDDLLGIADADVPLPTLDLETRSHRLTAMVSSLLMMRTEPTLFVIEDAQWIDATSESMLADFLTAVTNTHSLVLVTSRPDYRGAFAQSAGAQTIMLAPLSDSDSAELISELLGTDRSVAELSHVIGEKASGNPFFVQEMVREMAQRGVLVGERGSYACRTNIADVSVPATVQAAIAARIDRLGAGARRTLNAASVIGAHFDSELLSMLGVDAEFDELLDAELIDDKHAQLRAEFVFHHPLIHAVAYESQLKSDRTVWHRRLAVAMQERASGSVDEHAVLIAEHLESAGDLQAAHGWHMRAAAWATNRDVAAARRSWERASQIADRLPDDDPDHMRMRIAPRTMLCATDYFERSGKTSRDRVAELEQLCHAAGDKISLAIAMTGLITELCYAGRSREGARLASEQVALLESIGDPALTIGLAFIAFVTWFDAGEFAELLRWSELLVDLADGDPAKGAGFGFGSPLAIALAYRGTARWWMGRPGWREDLDDSVAMARTSNPATFGAVVCWAYAHAMPHGVISADDTVRRASTDAIEALGTSNYVAQRLAEYTLAGAILSQKRSSDRTRAMELMLTFQDTARQLSPFLVPVAELWMTQENVRHGERDVAITSMRHAVEELHTARRLFYGSWGTGVLVEALLLRGAESDVSEARRRVDELADLWTDDGSAMRDLWLLRLRTLVARASGDAVFPELLSRYRGLAKSLGYQGHIAWAEAMTDGGA